MIVEGLSIAREGLRAMLDRHHDLLVVAEATDRRHAVALVAQRSPDVAVIGADIPGGDIVQIVRDIREASPRTELIVLASSDDPGVMRDVIMSGARGYLFKWVSHQVLLAAIRNLRSADESIVLTVSRSSFTKPPQSPELLSRRELEILGLAGRALTNGQIAARVGLSEATVKRHLRNIFAKLGAVSRLDAVNKAMAASLMPNPLHQRDEFDGQDFANRRAMRAYAV